MRPSATPARRLLLTGIAAAAACALALPGVASAAPLSDWNAVGPQQFGGWNAVASDADGTALIASGRYGAVVRSVDSGTTWAAVTGLTLAPMNAVRSVASDADGSVLAVAGQYDQLYVSTDAGATWSAGGRGNGSTDWTAVDVDADGSVVIAVTADGAVRRSLDSGTTWSWQNAPGPHWTAASVDADGSTMVLTGLDGSPYDGVIWSSLDSGTTWNALSSAPRATWTGIALSDDGATITAVSEANPNGAGRVAQSTDGGVTWHDLTTGGTSFSGIAVSTDASTVAVAGDAVRISHDGGSSWSSESDAPANAAAIATGSDGTRILVGSPHDHRLALGTPRPVPLSAPQFTTEPQAVSGPVGSTVRLTTAVSGNPAPRVHWQRTLDGGSTWTDVAGALTDVLDVVVADPSVQESYRAVAQNSLSYRTSAVVRVTALPAPAPAAAPAATARIAPRFPVGARLSAGLDVSLSGSGLAPGSTWTVDLFSTPTRIASGTVAGGGALAETVRIPARTPAGAHRLLLNGTAPNGAPVTSQAWFALDAAGVVTAVSTTGPVPAPAPTSGRGTRGLAQTGAELPVAGLAGLAALLLAGAGVALVAARRRRTV